MSAGSSFSSVMDVAGVVSGRQYSAMRRAGSRILVRMTVSLMLSARLEEVVSSTRWRAIASSRRMDAHSTALRLLCWKRIIRGVVWRRET